jgi:hypothetical protein
MQISRWMIGATASATIMFAPGHDALACSCGDIGPACQNYFQVAAVFVGTVESITSAPDQDPPYGKLRIEFAVAETFRGTLSSKATAFTATSGAACGYQFKVGERYLVYAHGAKEGARLDVSICSRTRLLSQAADDVQYLRSVSKSTPGGRVYGSITHWERDLATRTPRDYGPVPDVLVTLRGPLNTQVATDEHGRFEAAGLPPGRYEITAVPPPQFSTQHLQRTIELRDARACFVADFGVQYDGRIRGSVKTSDGQPAAGARIDVMAIELVGTSGNIETMRVIADAGGAFEIAEVPPGQYVVGVDLIRRINAELVFPMTFHPGTADPALATVVRVGNGTRHELEPLTVQPPRRVLRLTGQITFEDGTPVSRASISLQDGAATWRQVAYGINTEFDGSFSFLVHEGLSYVVNAWYNDPDDPQAKQLRTTVGPFVVSDQIGPLHVVLTRTR